MKTMVYIVKRSNGCYGIYIGGKTSSHLASNSFLSDSADTLLSSVLYRMSKIEGEAELVITDNCEEFKSDLPSFEGFCAKENIVIQ